MTGSASARWRDAGPRQSGGRCVTLKALTYAPTGGIVAAPTTSLPEAIGGVRNWDYRFCWLRDATLTLLAFLRAGYLDEARQWRDWLLRAIAGSPRGPPGPLRRRRRAAAGRARAAVARRLRRIEARPHRERRVEPAPARRVRRGHRCPPYVTPTGLEASDDAWAIARKLFEWLESGWREPDEGIWEVRGPRRHFTHSKVMCWVAFDRAVKAIGKLGRGGPARPLAGDEGHDQGGRPRERLQRRGRRVRPVLRLGPARREPPADPARRVPPGDGRAGGRARWRRSGATSCATASSSATAADTTTWTSTGCRPVKASSFPARSGSSRCSPSRAASTRRSSSTSGCSRSRNDLGLLAEEYDTGAPRLVGNFPQAFTHLTLVETAFTLRRKLDEQGETSALT